MSRARSFSRGRRHRGHCRGMSRSRWGRRLGTDSLNQTGGVSLWQKTVQKKSLKGKNFQRLKNLKAKTSSGNPTNLYSHISKDSPWKTGKMGGRSTQQTL